MIIEAVIFDMDGTLLDTERVCLNAFVETGEAFGLPDLTPTFMKIVGRSGITEEKVISEALKGRVSFEQFIEGWDRAMDTQLRHSVPLKDGAMELCSRLAEKNVPMAVATSTMTARAVAHLEHARLASFFSHIIGGDQVTHRKPDPEPYLKVAGLLGVLPANCAMFEDSDPGTLAAIRAGGVVVQVPDLAKPGADVQNMGHLIAPNLMAGARQIGLL